jgi:hypothetical protein
LLLFSLLVSATECVLGKERLDLLMHDWGNPGNRRS